MGIPQTGKLSHCSWTNLTGSWHQCWLKNSGVSKTCGLLLRKTGSHGFMLWPMSEGNAAWDVVPIKWWIKGSYEIPPLSSHPVYNAQIFSSKGPSWLAVLEAPNTSPERDIFPFIIMTLGPMCVRRPGSKQHIKYSVQEVFMTAARTPVRRG